MGTGTIAVSAAIRPVPIPRLVNISAVCCTLGIGSYDPIQTLCAQYVVCCSKSLPCIRLVGSYTTT